MGFRGTAGRAASRGLALLHDALVAAGVPCVGHVAEQVLADAVDFHIALDEHGTVLSWNRSAERVFGFTAEQAVGRAVHDLIVPAAAHAAHLAGIDHYRQTGRGRGIGASVQVEALHRDGSVVPVELSISGHATGSSLVFHALGRDLVRQRRDQRVLEVLAAHRAGLLRTSDPDAVRALLCDTAREALLGQGAYLFEPVRGSAAPDGLVTLRCTASSMDHARGFDPGFTVDVPLALVPARVRRRHVRTPAVRAALETTGLQTVGVEPLRHGDDLYAVLVVGWLSGTRELGPDDEQLLGLLASETALVLERLDTRDRLELAARTDPLTGLDNRRAFDEALAVLVAAAEVDGGPLSLLTLDLDRFKAFNDTHGHSAGDALLLTAAHAWTEVLDADLRLARTGGDEFALLLPGRDGPAAVRTAERLVAATPLPVGLSTGCAEWSPGTSAHDLLQAADRALYAAKRAR